jgi:hypothetical protein
MIETRLAVFLHAIYTIHESFDSCRMCRDLEIGNGKVVGIEHAHTASQRCLRRKPGAANLARSAESDSKTYV